MESLQKVNLSAEIVSNIVLKGDIGGLTPGEKVQYYRSVCERVGLDPATQPFQLLNLQGKQVLYCSKAGAEQLTKNHKVSHEIRERQTINDIHIVYVRASLPDGRFEDSSGAVTIGNLKGDALANALMKAETKAKRRSTLSLLGLGMLDETEVETIPNAIPERGIEVVGENGAVATVEQPKKEVAENVSLNTFDPTKEVIGFGKHKGTEWAQVPVDYLQYLLTGPKNDNTRKAEATLKYREQIASQKSDPFDGVFDRRPRDEVNVSPQQAVPLFDQLESELGDIVHKFGDKESLKFWGENNAERIHQLPEDQQETFRKAFRKAMREAA